MSEPLLFSVGNSSMVCLYLYAFEIVKTLKMSTTNTMMIEIIKVSNIYIPPHFMLMQKRIIFQMFFCLLQ